MAVDCSELKIAYLQVYPIWDVACRLRLLENSSRLLHSYGGLDFGDLKATLPLPSPSSTLLRGSRCWLAREQTMIPASWTRIIAWRLTMMTSLYRLGPAAAFAAVLCGTVAVHSTPASSADADSSANQGVITAEQIQQGIDDVLRGLQAPGRSMRPRSLSPPV